MLTVSMLVSRLLEIQRTYPNAPISAQGWNDSGDLMDLKLRGDVRIERDAFGQAIIIIR